MLQAVSVSNNSINIISQDYFIVKFIHLHADTQVLTLLCIPHSVLPVMDSGNADNTHSASEISPKCTAS